MADKSINRRDFLKWFGLTAAAGAIGGCVAPTPEVIEVEKEVEKVVTQVVEKVVTPTPETKPDELVMIWQTISNQDKLFKPVLDRWEADYGIPVRWIQTPNIEEQVTKTLSMFVAGEVMDVFTVMITSFAQFAEEGIIIPLDGMPGLDDYFEIAPASVKSLTQYKGKTMGMVQWVASQCGCYNKKFLEQGGWESPPETWEEWEDHCLKAKKDGIATYPTLWMCGTGIDHLNSVFYSLVGGAGGKVTEGDGTPTLGPGSKAREVLTWWAKSFLETEISDPRSLELRYYPAAKAYAQGQHLYHLGTRQTFFTVINGGDSPTIGQHDIFKQPGGPSLITGDSSGVGSTSENPEWAWKLMQYLIGKTKDGEYLGPSKLATEVLTPYPAQAVEDPVVSKLWSNLFSLDVALETLADTIAVTDIAPAIMTPWWPKWQDTVNTKLQECLAGLITPDEACDEMADSAMELKG